jgi:hypothetical protein
VELDHPDSGALESTVRGRARVVSGRHMGTCRSGSTDRSHRASMGHAQKCENKPCATW